MVNYCCIPGCNRNSRVNKHLNFYGLPKEKHRQKQWLQLAGRKDLIDKEMDKLRKNLRFCSRHFPPSSIVNKHLSTDALPTKSLPGSMDEDEPNVGVEKHEGIICDSCQDPVQGFRYKCVTCDNFDLCQKCEMLETHPHHYMLRIPKSIKFKIADDLINKWRNLFHAEHVLPDEEASSDDEPVTKYMRNHDNDSGVDLSEDVKKDIRDEVARALKAVKEKVSTPILENILKEPKNNKKETPLPICVPIEFERVKMDNVEIPVAETVLVANETQPAQLVFADVNAVKFDPPDEKPQVSDTPLPVPSNFMTDENPTQPMLYVTLSSDFSQFMIELAPDNNAAEGSSGLK